MSFSEVLKNVINYFFENIYLMGIWGKVVIISQETFPYEEKFSFM